MSGDTMYGAPRKANVAKMRAHDYIYDSAFIVSGARDYARMAFKAAMASAQIVLQPVYKSMFSETRMRPRIQVVYYPNCRLPPHIDRSYGGYQERVRESKGAPAPDFDGKDRFKYSAIPKQVLPLNNVTPTFHPPTPAYETTGPTRPRNRGTQSFYRESSAQTVPWQPDGRAAETCENTPEVLYLDKLEWGPGMPFRIGDLPADFHTTEIINKLRHARTWTGLVERGGFPRWMKKRDSIISDIETKDWIFREAEIDELQDIRLELLHRMQQQQRLHQTNRTSKKLAKLWANKKHEMEKKIDHIRKTRDRELRKLSALHGGGGRAGQVERMREARGAGAMTPAARDPTSDLHAPRARHGYQARRRHANIYYDPSLLSLEDHQDIAQPPAWLEQCGQDLKRTCSGHCLQRDPTKLCERETKWSEQFLESLHNDLKKARLGAAMVSSGPLHVLKPRRLAATPRPTTPEVEAVDDSEETNHQAALVLQRILRGRAVQNLMYEGRTRASELTEELKTTHGLQRQDKTRIAKEESKAREYNAIRTEAEQRDDAVTALVDELCGGAVAAALDFLEKELKRLKEERKQHAFILIASLEDHQDIAQPPAWLEQCGQDLKRTCSGHCLQRDPTKLCERETKWSEQFLESLHNDLKKARLGAAMVSSGPLHVLKPRRLAATPRPTTPEVEAVDDSEETNHQAALVLQRILRGRAVQNLMYEGRTRASELTEELKTTHGLQRQDKTRIAKEESKAREYNAIRTEAEQRDDAVTALVDELCGGAVAAALDFLEKELKRLKEERKQHAFILIALREKTMREAAEAGRRQKEEHRRREHDEMFKQILGVTQETVDTYLNKIVTDGVELAAEEAAVWRAQSNARAIDEALEQNSSVSTAEQNELVAELVQQFLLPHVHKTAARHRITEHQRSKLEAARKTIFGLIDKAEKLKEAVCTRCGVALDELCRCRVCPITNEPLETVCRDDPRWKHTTSRPRAPARSSEERYPAPHEMRCMLNAVIDDVVLEARRRRGERDAMSLELVRLLREHAEAALDAREFVECMVDRVVGTETTPPKVVDYRHLMLKVVKGALERTEPYPKSPCPQELPSEIRRRAEEKAAAEDPTCRCEEVPATKKSRVQFGLATMSEDEKRRLLPSELRMLEEMRRCKCDTSPTPSPNIPELYDDTTTEVTDVTATEASSVPEDTYEEYENEQSDQ